MINVSGKNVKNLSIGDKKVLSTSIGQTDVPIQSNPLDGIIYTGDWCYTGWKATSNFEDLGKDYFTVKGRDDLCIALKTSGSLTFKYDGCIDAFLLGGGGSGAVNIQNDSGGFNDIVSGNDGYNTTAFNLTANGGKGGLDTGKGGNGGSGGGSAYASSSTLGAGAGGHDGDDGDTAVTLAGGTGQGTTTKAFASTEGYLFAGAGGGSAAVETSGIPYNKSGAGGLGGGTAGGSYSTNNAINNSGAGTGACSDCYTGKTTGVYRRYAGGGGSGYTTMQEGINIVKSSAYSIIIGDGGASAIGSTSSAKTGKGGSGVVLIKKSAVEPTPVVFIDWYRYLPKVDKVYGEEFEVSYATYGSVRVFKGDGQSLVQNEDLTFSINNSGLLLNTSEKWDNYFDGDTYTHTLLNTDYINHSALIYEISFRYPEEVTKKVRPLTLQRGLNLNSETIIQGTEDAHTEGFDGTYYWYKTSQR